MNWVIKIQEAVDYIEDNLFEDISNETVGEWINYAPSSFSNIFSAMTGYSVGEYVRFRRLSCAMEQLAENMLSVTEAAFMCRYETVESFSKAFKRMFDCSPSQCFQIESDLPKFLPVEINFTISGGFCMKRNVIPNVREFDWSDNQRQNEFVNSVISALNALGEKLTYDYVCAVSGSAMRTSFSMKSFCEFNHGNYHVINTPAVIDHTFKMLGYDISHYVRGDYSRDRKLIMDSIDKENGHIIIINGKCPKPAREEIYSETIRLVSDLIGKENMAIGQYNGLTAHRMFANALKEYEWEDNFEPYLNVMCNYKQYLDRQYAAAFFRDNQKEELAAVYFEIARLAEEMNRLVPQDFSVFEIFDDKENLKPYCDIIMQIHDLEQKALGLM